MKEAKMLDSIVNTKMENFILPQAALQWINQNHNIPALEKKNNIRTRRNAFIRENFKEWNQMTTEQQQDLASKWVLDATLIHYLEERGIINDNYRAIEIMQNGDDEGNLVGCEIRVYYNDMGVSINNGAEKPEQEDTKKTSKV